MKRIKFLIFVWTALMTLPGFVFAQTIVQESIQPRAKIKVELIKGKRDDVGTDVSNIYTVLIKNEGEAISAPYAIVYFLDGKVTEVFRNQPLPFSFKRNFKGQAPGRHELKIVIEGANDMVIDSDSVNVDVVKSE